MRRNRGVITGIVGVMVAVAVLQCVQIVPAAAAPGDYASDAALNRQASVAAERLQERLGGASSAVAAVAIRADGIEVSVSGELTTQQQGEVQSAGSMAPIRIRKVANSAATLNAVMDRIVQAVPGLAGHGISISTVAQDVDANRVRVSLTTYSTPAAKQIVDQFGADLVVVTAADAPVAGADRFSDFAPWYGGGALFGSGGECTSWFQSYSGGTAYAALAGHCGTGAWSNNGTTVGTVNYQDWSNGGVVDAERIPVSSNTNYVFADPGTPTRRVVSVTSSISVGTLLCTDGVSDDEVCNVQVTATGVYINYDGKGIYSQIQAQQTSGVYAFSAGDSGGPVYQLQTGGYAKAYGMVVARQLSNPAIGWFTPAATVESALGITIKTS